jgi:hypothetical protein
MSSPKTPRSESEGDYERVKEEKSAAIKVVQSEIRDRNLTGGVQEATTSGGKPRDQAPFLVPACLV